MHRISNIQLRAYVVVVPLIFFAQSLLAQIPHPKDAPQPLTPEESLASFQVPAGFRMELVASEPLIREPSGVCWDAQGRLYVSELHGYNLEGQYDIDDLNKTGKLDREVRRVQANPQAKEAALAGTYGTIKRLHDTDGDGFMDSAIVFADHIPPAYGICAARGGLIVACAPHILFLADRDGDGEAEVRELLYTGFRSGVIERGINAPQWGLDNWIYFGRGHTGGTITGPRLKEPFPLGTSNFRVKADGSAIEQVSGTTGTFGHAITGEGDRFVISTSRPGYFVAPLPWPYLARNPNMSTPSMETDAGGYARVYPLAPPHPWRTKRAEDPGFFKYYRDRYGAGDSDAGGFFTSACSPLVYQDQAFPPEFQGNYFVCEPAQNLVHRALVERKGSELRLRRPPGEEMSEFLASKDVWFHPINLSHGPDGSLFIVDMYREIIEDYSAVPRFLQQQYGLTNGMNHGRIWKLSHDSAPKPPPFDMSELSEQALAMNVISPYIWRRETARRLLIEKGTTSVVGFLSHMARGAGDASSVVNALQTLEGLGRLSPRHVKSALSHPQPGVRRQALILAEPWLNANHELLDQVLSMADQSSSTPAPEGQDTRYAPLILQLALSLGESRDARVLPALADLARQHADLRWMPQALLSSLHGRSTLVLEELLQDATTLGQASLLLGPLCASLSAQGEPSVITHSLSLFAQVPDPKIQLLCLKGFRSGLSKAGSRQILSEGYQALNRVAASSDPEVQKLAQTLFELFEPADPETRLIMLAEAAHMAADLSQPAAHRLAAVTRLSRAREEAAMKALLAAWPPNTPVVQSAILEALFARRDRLPRIVDALENNQFPPSALTAFQRATLLEHEDLSLRHRAAALLQRKPLMDDARFRSFALALKQSKDLAHGEQIFRDHCASCHQLRGIGFAVGPDLGAEFQRAEEAILRDILAPNDVITAGYSTYVIETTGGLSMNGVMANESATSLTLKQVAGLEWSVLRKDIASMTSKPVSLMPEALAETLQPKDVADVIAWLRTGQSTSTEIARSDLVLFDDEAAFLEKLTQGGGQANLESTGAFSGQACLSITPTQRYSDRIPGWNYRITEHPQPGEFRYLRLAWKAPAQGGVMVELAADGHWPSPQTSSRRYYAGRNTTAWKAIETSPTAPVQWQVRTFDLWKDNGAFTLTGIAPTAMNGRAYFDRIELLRTLPR